MSDFLFARPSFIGGAMTIIDLFGISQEYNASSSEKSADTRAMRADANAIKSDFLNAYNSMVEAYAQ